MRFRHVLFGSGMGFLLSGLLAVAGCSNEDGGDHLSQQKLNMIRGAHEGQDPCVQLGLPSGCDVCAELGYYGDGVCDNALIQHGLCDGPDVDCQAAETDCSDGIDGDGDGQVDCADPDCAYTPACWWDDAVCGNGIVEASEECDDGNTAGGDGCSMTCTLEARPEVCGDGIDNDADGQVDEGCATCTDADGDGFCLPQDCDDADPSVSPGSAELCGDGIDNDCDGMVDEGCGAEVCDDRTDNDGDGLIDCADPDCASDPFCLCGNGVLDSGEECDDGNNTDGDGCSSTCLLEVVAEVCDDGIDNDRDGLVDCADPDCTNDPACP